MERVSQMLFEEGGQYRKRKIRQDAEEFILEEAKAFPRSTSITIIIFLPVAEENLQNNFSSAVHQHFFYCREKASRERKRTLQYGWRALAIAFVLLGIALSISHLLDSFFPHNSIANTTEESLTILGWVAFWKPAELLLYNWYPFSRDMALYARLERSVVQVANIL